MDAQYFCNLIMDQLKSKSRTETIFNNEDPICDEIDHNIAQCYFDNDVCVEEKSVLRFSSAAVSGPPLLDTTALENPKLICVEEKSLLRFSSAAVSGPPLDTAAIENPNNLFPSTQTENRYDQTAIAKDVTGFSSAEVSTGKVDASVLENRVASIDNELPAIDVPLYGSSLDLDLNGETVETLLDNEPNKTLHQKAVLCQNVSISSKKKPKGKLVSIV